MTMVPTQPHPSTMPTAVVRSALWLRSMAYVMQGVSRILLDKSSLSVRVVAPSGNGWNGQQYEFAPGWTDGADVFLNADVLVPQITVRGGGGVEEMVASIKGLCFHENFHIMYTPAPYIVAPKASYSGAVLRAFNMLEDQRIERLGIAKWPHVRGYMIHLITEWLLTDGKPSNMAHVLLYGRDYLSQSIRRLARKQFKAGPLGQHTLTIEAIIRQYVKLVLPRDLDKAVSLSEQLSKLLWPTTQAESDDRGQNPTGHGVGDHPDTGGRTEHRPNEREQDEAQKEAGDVADPGTDPDGDDADGEGDGAGAAGDEPGTEEGEGQSGQGTQGDGDGGDLEADAGDGESAGGGGGRGDQGEPDDKPTEADGVGEGGGSSSGGTAKSSDVDDELREAAEEERESLNDDPDFADDLRETVGSVRKHVAKRSPQAGLSEWTSKVYRPATGAPQVASQHTRRVIKELQDYVAPGWDRQMESGRVNPDAYLRRQPGSTDFFDQWNPGREKDASAEVVVLIDVSGSMSGIIMETSQAMWTIKSSMDALGIPCTVIAFSDDGEYVYKRTDRTQKAQYRTLHVVGGTNPCSSLEEATAILGSSTARTRLLFVITDGDFDEPVAAQERLDLLRGIGVVTSYIGMGPVGEKAGKRQSWYRCNAHGVANGPMDVPKIVRNTVKAAIARQVLG